MIYLIKQFNHLPALIMIIVIDTPSLHTSDSFFFITIPAQGPAEWLSVLFLGVLISLSQCQPSFWKTFLTCAYSKQIVYVCVPFSPVLILFPQTMSNLDIGLLSLIHIYILAAGLMEFLS